jgi:hypothetical protein
MIKVHKHVDYAVQAGLAVIIQTALAPDGLKKPYYLLGATGLYFAAPYIKTCEPIGGVLLPFARMGLVDYTLGESITTKVGSLKYGKKASSVLTRVFMKLASAISEPSTHDKNVKIIGLEQSRVFDLFIDAFCTSASHFFEYKIANLHKIFMMNFLANFAADFLTIYIADSEKGKQHIKDPRFWLYLSKYNLLDSTLNILMSSVAIGSVKVLNTENIYSKYAAQLIVFGTSAAIVSAMQNITDSSNSK